MDRLLKMWPEIVRTLESLEKGTNLEFLCALSKIPSVQVDWVGAFAKQGKDQFATIASTSPNDLFVFTHSPPTVNGKAVIAFTDLGPAGVIRIFLDQWLELSDQEVWRLALHEIGHKILSGPSSQPIADHNVVPGFSGKEQGYAALNAFADCTGDYRSFLGSYPEQVKRLSPYLYFRFEEAAGSVANDSSGNNRHAKYTGDYELQTEGALAKGSGAETNHAVKLQNRAGGWASHGMVTFTLPPSQVQPGARTSTVFWLSRPPDSLQDYVVTFFPGSSNNASMNLVFAYGAFGFNSWYDVWGIAENDVSRNEWVHVAVNWCHGCVTSGEIFVNGVRAALTQRAGVTNPAAPSFPYVQLGTGPHVGTVLGLDEFALFDRALSEVEILGLYRAGVPSFR